ncbi:IclR family transcriptional regulator [Nocardia sp. NPDC050193]
MTTTLNPDPHPTMETLPLPPSMIERVTLIMDSFERAHTRRTLEQISNRTGLPRSTAYRILEQLVKLRWLERTAMGYRLGARSLNLGGRELGHNALRSVSAPVLLDLAMRTELVVHLAVLDGRSVYLLDKVGWRSAPAVPSRVGSRLPVHCTALGKAMLAWSEPASIEDEFATGVVRRTPRSIGDLGVLYRQLDRVRRENGIAIERGECYPGIGCMSLAVLGASGPIAAISVVSGADSSLEHVTPLLIGAVRAVSEGLFGTRLAPGRNGAGSVAS